MMDAPTSFRYTSPFCFDDEDDNAIALYLWAISV